MLDSVDYNDPMSTAAAALCRASAVAPLVRHRLPDLFAEQDEGACARVADLVESDALFEKSALIELRAFLATIDGIIAGTLLERRIWVPVRCIDGYEQLEEVTIRERMPHGDAIVAIASELEEVIELASRTVALRRAAELFSRSR